MKKLLSILAIIVVITLAFNNSIICANAIDLPNGGSEVNCGTTIARGRTSGGSDGYANMECSITGSNTIVMDAVSAKMKSDVRTASSAYIYVQVYYVDSSAGTMTHSNNDSTTLIPDDGFTCMVVSPNLYAYKGTAGYGANFATRGSWVCGTTYTF